MSLRTKTIRTFACFLTVAGGGAETVIVQIIGEGPATTTQVDSSKAFWLDVSH